MLINGTDDNDMRRQLLCLLLVLGTSPARADDPPEVVLPLPRTLEPSHLHELPFGVSPLLQVRGALEKLKEERSALDATHLQVLQSVQDADTSGNADLSGLRLRLGGLLTELSQRKSSAASKGIMIVPEPKKLDLPAVPEVRPVPAPKDPPAKSPDVPPELAKALDPLALAQALFRAGNYQGALQAYRLLPLEGLRGEQRAPIQYMIACCLRKLGQTDEATALFREVANIRGDEVVAECAQWQLALIRWQRDLSTQLVDVQRRRQALEKQP